jgi:hypothetical protein
MACSLATGRPPTAVIMWPCSWVYQALHDMSGAAIQPGRSVSRLPQDCSPQMPHQLPAGSTHGAWPPPKLQSGHNCGAGVTDCGPALSPSTGATITASHRPSSCWVRQLPTSSSERCNHH